MNILITNDDGYEAKGINALYESLSAENSVYMFAPNRERSACSNAITIYDNLSVKKVDTRKFSVDGYPADCVNIALHSGIINDNFDVVISGINHGPNLADDVYYSGTVGAARTGFVFGLNSIAVSLNSKDDLIFLKDTADFVAALIKGDDFLDFKSPRFYNINYPAAAPANVKGVKYTKLGKRFYKDKYLIIDKSDDSTVFKLDGYLEWAEMDNSDVTEIDKGYISITPMHLDTTEYNILKIMNDKAKQVIV